MADQIMSPYEIALRQSIKDDFHHFARVCLKITTRAAELIPFKLNKCQTYIHNIIEQQLRDTGKVRVIILKGRQQGISTYAEGRQYWKVIHSENVKAFILTNNQLATNNLYQMLKTFQEFCHYLIKPFVSKSNATELDFKYLRSGYRVSTAGAQQVGRALTLQYFHGSEVAFWTNAKEHMSGVFQAISNEPGTEVILESTANGATGFFYDFCMKALSGESDYELIFVPWYWEDSYKTPISTDITINWTQEELDYQEEWGLDAEQMLWRRNKINTDFFGDITQMRREYPASIEEAFKVGVKGALWLPDDIKHISNDEFNKLLWDDYEDDEYNEERYAVDFTVVGYDPATTGNATSDEHGVITVTRLSNGKIYVRDDSSAKLKPKNALPKVLVAYERFDADRIRVEVNNGGEWIPDAFEMVDETVPVIPIHATKNKKIRAGPVAQAYRIGKVIHVGHFHVLEDEMCSWVYGQGESPNRIDGLVYAVLDCLDLDGEDDTPVMISRSR